MSVLQGLKYILPIITVPYLVRVIGPEKFGLVSFAQALIMYFMMLTDYGFNLSATRRLAINKHNTNLVSEIFSTVLLIQLILLLLCFLIMNVIVFGISKFSHDWLIYYWTFGLLLGNIFSITWFFQGMEKMKFITAINIISKSAFIVSIFFLVHSEADYLKVAILNTLGYLVAGGLSFFVALWQFKIIVRLPTSAQIKNELGEGYHIFISSVAANIYTFSSVFVLGLMTNNTIVGYYSAGEKIVKAIQALFNPVSQTIFPYLSQLAKKSRVEALRFARKITLISGYLLFIICIVLYLFADKIVLVALGDNYLATIVILKWLAFMPLIANLGNIFGTQILINFDYAILSSKAALIASIVNIPLVILSVYYFQAIGAASAMLFTEILVASILFYFMETRGLSLRKRRIMDEDLPN